MAQDAEMTDAVPGAEVDGEQRPEKQRLRLVCATGSYVIGQTRVLTFWLQLPGYTDTAASFAFEREDHTLGNALRYIIMKK